MLTRLPGMKIKAIPGFYSAKMIIIGMYGDFRCKQAGVIEDAQSPLSLTFKQNTLFFQYRLT
ncbi:hypothetical protein D3C81_2286930 [compost metagenome]